MATTKGSNWTRRVPVPVGNGTEDVFLTHTSLTLGAAADILKVVPIPAKGVMFTNARMRCSDMDTNATPTLVFTLRYNDGAASPTTKVLLHQTTIGQGGGVITPTKVPATEPGIGFTTNTSTGWLEIHIDTASATAAAGTLDVEFSLTGWYPTGAVTSE